MPKTAPALAELKTLATRIRRRAEAERDDRARQRELIRAARAQGATYADIEAAGRMSRPTLRNALHGGD